jgi:4-amino-4-deoxy-L-arabinose transferase-like glycosyltransferase
MFKNKPLLTIAVFLFICIGLVYKNFLYGDVLFHNWDEGIYSQVAWEIKENTSLSTTFNGTVWLNKPPLSHALIAVAFAVFGRSEFWARMVMVIFGMLLLWATYALGKKVMEHLFRQQLDTYGHLHRQVIFLIPVVALASAPLFIERSLLLNTDVMLGLGWVLFFLANTYTGKLLAVTFGVVSKSIVGFYPALVSILNLTKKDLSLRNIPKLILIIVVPLVWHIISYVRFGDYFIQAHLFDQVVKRVVSPIELHYGERWYYMELLWNNIGLLVAFMLIAYLILSLRTVFTVLGQYISSKKISFLWIYTLLLAGVAVFFVIPGPTTDINMTVAGVAGTIILLLHLIWKKFFMKDEPDNLRYFIMLLSPLPFFGLLMMSQSKIGWYLVTLLPLFVLALPYLYMQLRFSFIRLPLLALVLFYFVVQFIPATYGYQQGENIPDEKMVLAQCISQLPNERMAVLVDAQERQNRLVLESTQLQTETSFTYGGAPSFVYYAQKDIKFFYNGEGFQKEYWQYPIVTFAKNEQDLGTSKQKIIQSYSVACETNNWITYINNL